VQVFEPREVSIAGKQIGGIEREWISAGARFMEPPAASDISTYPGAITMTSGETLQGRLNVLESDWYGTAVNYIGPSGKAAGIRHRRR